MKRIRVLLAAAAVLLFSTGAFAQAVFFPMDIGYNRQSTISRTTFHTYNATPYDAIRKPFQYGDVEENRSGRRLGWKGDGEGLNHSLLWVNIGNTTMEDTFGVAWLGKCKKGYASFQVAWRGSSDEFMDETESPPTVSTFHQQTDEDAVNLFAGYGWDATDKVSVGVGIAYDDGSFEFHERDETSGVGGDVIMSNFERTDTTLIAGVKVHTSDTFTWTAEVKFGQVDAESLDRQEFFDASGMTTASFTDPFLDLDADKFGVGTELVFYTSDTLEYVVSARWRETDWNLKNQMIEFDDIGGMITPLFNITNSDISETRTHLGGRVGWHPEDRLHVFGGLKFFDESAEIDFTGNDGDPNFPYREGEEFSEEGIRASVSAIYEVMPRVALVIGGTFEHLTSESESTFFDVTSMFRTLDQFEFTDSNAMMRAGIEFRFDRFLVDVGFGSTEATVASAGAVEAIDTDYFILSARIGI